MGNFNVIRYLHGKVSHISPVLSELVDFNECLLHCGLDDINGSGCEYTWYNKQDAQTRVYTKLDRFMDPGVSDHSPTLLRFHGDIRPPRRFKFLNCWVDHPDFHKTVAEAWACDVAGNSMFRLMGKLKAVKKKLKLLHSTRFSYITKRVKVKQADLAHCYQALQADPLSPALIQKEQAASADFWKLKRIEMCILSQRAKIHDVKHNDTSSRFFFQEIKERQHQQLIGAVAPIDPEIFTKGARVDLTDCAKLTSPITRSEIKQALFSIDVNKSPGIDGFSSGFFRAVWDIVKVDFCKAVEELFTTGHMPKQCVKLGLTHLVFADDLMIFLRGDLPTVYRATAELAHFSTWSGLTANLDKTEIYFGGVSEEVKQLILQATSLQEGVFPFRYLGIPIHASRLHADMYGALLLKLQ
ncbi:uncharacterized protein LOC141641192 [Silene latifolia]|uniref:uncharacterized protein LOC141641192 n=1 Tax=Silene latifolia TaxID=37657 RepID=UPI003D7760A0